ncbi:unnamed protein product [Lactuca saligna]|uniref:Senescence domain-containing protein n=1 Tax=Lactuca saligna TaxID=75948 RepID=A0AA35ZIJ9_LACSI|nr:unnamed protein product [Lactuca saligna]
MICCGTKKPRTLSPPRTTPPPMPPQTTTNHLPQPQTAKHETLLSIPNSKVHIMDEGEAVELANGNFTLFQISNDNILLATIIKIGDDLQWPLTKDEPVVKLDPHHYLFTLPVIKDIDWKEFAPKIDAYNNVLAKAIAGGTGQIVRGIFMCSNAYTNQLQKGGDMILKEAMEEKHGISRTKTIESNKTNGTKKGDGINKSLRSARKLSKMTESMSKALLNGVGMASGSVMGPAVRSRAGKAFFNSVPGEVVLASLDAINIVMDAAEVAQRQALAATSDAAARAVSERYGEEAGEATGDAIATVGHVAGTAWNVVKIRKAINPASAVKNASKIR